MFLKSRPVLSDVPEVSTYLVVSSGVACDKSIKSDTDAARHIHSETPRKKGVGALAVRVRHTAVPNFLDAREAWLLRVGDLLGCDSNGASAGTPGGPGLFAPFPGSLAAREGRPGDVGSWT